MRAQVVYHTVREAITAYLTKKKPTTSMIIIQEVRKMYPARLDVIRASLSVLVHMGVVKTQNSVCKECGRGHKLYSLVKKKKVS